MGSPTIFQATAIVLAGGRSRRMKQDKALLPVKGEPLIRFVCRQLEKLFPRIMISSSAPVKYKFLGYPVVADEKPGVGPMMAVLSSLRASTTGLNFIMACDIPLLDAAFVGRMLVLAGDGSVVVPRYEDGKMEPLFAFYPRRAVPVMERLINQGTRRITVLYEHYPTRFIPADGQSWLKNINTTGDYHCLLRRLRLPISENIFKKK